MIHTAILIVFFCIVHLLMCSFQQTIGIGKCPEDLKVVENFDMGGYLGVWYEQYRYFISSEIGYTCHRVNYTPTAEGPLKYITITFDTWKGRYTSRSGVVKIEGPELSQLLIEYPKNGDVEVMHWILDTDYTTYAVVWSCQNDIHGFHFKSIRIYTRQQHPKKDVINYVSSSLKSNNISSKLLKRTNQSNCCNCEVEEESYFNRDKEGSMETLAKKSREEIDKTGDNGVDEIESIRN